MYELLVGFPPYYTENIKKLYQSIRDAKLSIPTYLSERASNLLRVRAILVFFLTCVFFSVY